MPRRRASRDWSPEENRQPMDRALRLSFPDSGASCVAPLLHDVAPRTCDAVWEGLPLAGATVHGMYSGPEVFITADGLPDVELENGVHRAQPGDIGDWLNPPGRYATTPQRVVEIVLIYDRGAAIMGPDGQPTFVNLFARVTGDWDAFRQAAKATRTQGPARLLIERGDLLAGRDET